ncbi:MAG TPA: hypothetical protein PLZ84_04535, partial [Clostridia bacterium]|nr:hypothetical protein [Clostridia bacterium]
SILAGPLTGGLCNHQVTGTRYMNTHPTKTDIFMCFNISRFTNVDQFKSQCEEFLNLIMKDSKLFRIPSSNKCEEIELNKEVFAMLKKYL